MPTPNPAGPDILKLVIADMESRRAYGIEKYGQPLTTNNGRKPLVDLYQELLDAVQYTRQELEERKELEARLRAEVASEFFTQLLTFVESLAQNARNERVVWGVSDWHSGLIYACETVDSWATDQLTSHGILKTL